MPTPTNEPAAHRSLARALDVLELCSSYSPGYTLSQLCRKLNAPKSSLFPLVHTLAGRGWLTLDKVSQCYHIGSMAFHVGNHYLEGDTVMSELQCIMEHVVAGCGETCHLGSLKSGDVFYLKKIETPTPFRMISTVGRSLPAYSAGLGKALLADYTLPMLKSLYYDGLAPLTEHTITDFRVLAAQLEQVRATGFAYEVEESNRMIRCIAVPIRKEGKVVVSMSVAIPLSRYSEEKADLIRSLLTDARRQAESLIFGIDIQF